MKKYFILIAVTLCLMIIIKLILPKPLENKETTESFWSKKTNTTNKFDLIACGDSRTYRGISSDVLNEINLELSFINLGYSSAGLSDSYLDFVTSKLDPESKNKALIVGISPHSFTKEAKKNEALNSYLELSSFDKLRYQYLSPILKHFAPYKPINLIEGKRNVYLQDFNDDGWVASNRVLPDSTYALSGYKKTFSNYKVTKKGMISTLNKLKEIASTDITVIAFRIPTTEQMEMLEDSISGFEENFIKNELTKHSVIWLDFINVQFVSYDGSHLTKSSARKLSRHIGKKINELYLSKSKLH